MHKEHYLYPNKGMPRLKNETTEVSQSTVYTEKTHIISLQL